MVTVDAGRASAAGALSRPADNQCQYSGATVDPGRDRYAALRWYKRCGRLVEDARGAITAVIRSRGRRFDRGSEFNGALPVCFDKKERMGEGGSREVVEEYSGVKLLGRCS
jgi:hypothetical protein